MCNAVQTKMSKTVAVVAILAVLSALTVLRAGNFPPFTPGIRSLNSKSIAKVSGTWNAMSHDVDTCI